MFQRKKVVKQESVQPQPQTVPIQDPVVKKGKNNQREELELSIKSVQTPAQTVSKVPNVTVKRATISTVNMTPKQIIEKRRRRSSFATAARPSSFGVNLIEGSCCYFVFLPLILYDHCSLP